jgi:nitrogen regulatory protein P-II 1
VEAGCVKKIEAIIKPFKLEEVKDALDEAGIQGMTVTEVHGYGRERGTTGGMAPSNFAVDKLPKLKLEIVVADSECEPAVLAILRSAKTGRLGDGKVFVSHIERAIRIRTAETGGPAVSVPA